MGWEDLYLESRDLMKKADALRDESEKLQIQAKEVSRRACELRNQAYSEQQDYLNRLEERRAKGY